MRFNSAFGLIESLILGVVVRKRIEKQLSMKSRIIKIKLEKLVGEFPQNSMYKYIVISSLNSSPDCNYKIKSPIMSFDNTFSNQEYILCIENDLSHIVLNVMNSNFLLFDSFESQCVISFSSNVSLPFILNLNAHKDKLIIGDCLRFVAELSKDVYFRSLDLNDVNNHLNSPNSISSSCNTLQFKISYLSPLSNLCGWFTDISQDIFGFYQTQRVWVIYTQKYLYVYNSIHNTAEGFESATSSVACKNISYIIKKNHFEELPSPSSNLSGIEILFENSSKIISWIWGEDTGKSKGLWLNCISGGNIYKYR